MWRTNDIYCKSRNLHNTGTPVWQVMEEGRLSTCKLYVYIINIYRVLLFAGNPGAGKRVVYGCTQVCSATQFLAQIKQLGTEM